MGKEHEQVVYLMTEVWLTQPVMEMHNQGQRGSNPGAGPGQATDALGHYFLLGQVFNHTLPSSL